MTERVVVAGAGLAGLRTVRELRAAGFDGEIVLAGAEQHLPYDRPPLSKQLLSGRTDTAALTDAAELAELAVDVRLGSPLTGVDTAGRTVATAGGAIAYDRLVVATGAQPVPLFGMRTLRTVEDALAIRERLVAGSRLVVIGGGLIAFEIASVAVAAGVATTIVEALPSPLLRSMGARLGDLLAETAREHGVAVRCAARVVGVDDTGVRLADGTVLHADLVVAAVGARPATGWLAGSDLPADANGLRCDASGAADPDGRVWGVGDVAAWRSEGRHRRHEHWTRAVEQARVVAANLVAGTREPLDAVPYFWSDQFGHKIQGVGTPADHTEMYPGPVALFGCDGRLVGAVVVDQPRLLAGLRRAIRDGRTFAEAKTLLAVPR